MNKRESMRALRPKKERTFLSQAQQLKKHIKTGEPFIPGKYLCYIETDDQKDNATFQMATTKVIKWDRKWITKRKVLGWIGCLPVMSYDELRSLKDK